MIVPASLCFVIAKQARLTGRISGQWLSRNHRRQRIGALRCGSNIELSISLACCDVVFQCHDARMTITAIRGNSKRVRTNALRCGLPNNDYLVDSFEGLRGGDTNIIWNR